MTYLCYMLDVLCVCCLTLFTWPGFALCRVFMATGRILLCMSALVRIISSVLQSCSWSSTSDNNSMNDLVPCSSHSRSMMAWSLRTSLSKAFLLSSWISWNV